MSIRCFFALPLKPTAVRRLADHADSLCQYDSDGRMRWVDSDNFHLTLCFLGQASLELVEQLELLAKQKLAGVAPLQLRLDAIEYFPVNRELAVVAALAEPDEHLMALRALIIDVMREAGIATEQQDFKPHVTLGRIAAKAEFQEPRRWPAVEVVSLADSVVLYQSKQGHKGSVYTPLFDIPLTAQ